MKAVNAYYRKHKTLDGCPGLDSVRIEKLKVSMARDRHPEPKPYPSFRLTNNNAVIRQTKERIAELTRRAETDYEGSREIGFDLVQPPGCPPVSFEEWDNPYFPAATAGSIAAGYYELLHECYPLPDEESSRAEAVAEIVRFLQNGGPAKASQMKLSIASMTVKADVSEAVRERAEALIKELARFKGHEKNAPKGAENETAGAVNLRLGVLYGHPPLSGEGVTCDPLPRNRRQYGGIHHLYAFSFQGQSSAGFPKHRR